MTAMNKTYIKNGLSTFKKIVLFASMIAFKK